MHKRIFATLGWAVTFAVCIWIAASIGEITAQNSIAIRPIYSTWNFFEIFWPA